MSFLRRMFSKQRLSQERKNINRINKERQTDGLNVFKEYEIVFDFLNYNEILQKITQEIPIADFIPADTKDATYMHFKYKDISLVIVSERKVTPQNEPKLLITIEAFQRQGHVTCTRIKSNRRRAIKGLKDRKIEKHAQGKKILSRSGDGKKFLAVIVHCFSEIIDNYTNNSLEDYDLKHYWYGQLSAWWTQNKLLRQKQGPCVEEEFKQLNMCVHQGNGTYLIQSLLFAKWAKDSLEYYGLLFDGQKDVSTLLNEYIQQFGSPTEVGEKKAVTTATLQNTNLSNIPRNRNLYCFCKNKTRQQGGRKRKSGKRKTRKKRKKRTRKRKKYNRY